MSHICFYNANCACACRCVYMCVCDHGRVLYGSNYWQWGPSDTHSASHYGPNGMYLPPPFFFLSLLPCLFLLPLSFCTSFSFLFSLTGLNYFRMSPSKRARWNPFLFLLFIYLFLLWTIPPQRSPCNHILIQITHYQFVQTSPENTSPN